MLGEAMPHLKFLPRQIIGLTFLWWDDLCGQLPQSPSGGTDRVSRDCSIGLSIACDITPKLEIICVRMPNKDVRETRRAIHMHWKGSF